VVGKRGENFGVEKRWKKYIYAGREDGIFVHLKNGLNGPTNAPTWMGGALIGFSFLSMCHLRLTFLFALSQP